ncbi:MAG: ribosome biogenesis GTP-binding protein YihA/YsxC [Candidatus Gracilibacteria bacterium]
MNIKSARFIKGIVKDDDLLDDGRPQFAFIGRSNVGKSCTINFLTNQKELAKTSSTPGRTQEINLFLLNNSMYLLDLPGYGFVKQSAQARERLKDLIEWYLFKSHYKQKAVVIIVDANVGVTDSDMDMILELDEHEKNVIIVANKIDKIKGSEYKKKIQAIQEKVGTHKVVPYSTKKKIGLNALNNEIFG